MTVKEYTNKDVVPENIFEEGAHKQSSAGSGQLFQMLTQEQATCGTTARPEMSP